METATNNEITTSADTDIKVLIFMIASVVSYVYATCECAYAVNIGLVIRNGISKIAAWASHKRYIDLILAFLERSLRVDCSRKAMLIAHCGQLATLGFSFLQ